MSYLPIFVDIRQRRCLVVGGGEVGERKVLSLLDRDAEVDLVSREVTPVLTGLIEAGRVGYLGPDYETAHLDGAALVFAATDDTALNGRVSREAQERGIWVNAADQPEFCTFIVPASIRRGDLTIAVSTSGRSPAMAASIRARLEKEFGPEYADFLRLMGLVRSRVLAAGGASGRNKELFCRMVDSDLLDVLSRGDLHRVDELLTDILGAGFTLAEIGFDPKPES